MVLTPIPHFRITSFLQDTGKGNLQKQIQSYAKAIPGSWNGFAGFAKKTDLIKYLKLAIAPTRKRRSISKVTEKKVIQAISIALHRCREALPLPRLQIYVFPTYDSFVKKKMNGVNGYTPWRSTIFIFVHPDVKKLQYVKYTAAHEYAHVAMLHIHPWRTLQDSLIFEGVAEHFREATVGGKRAPWAKAITADRAKQIFLLLRTQLHNTNPNLYQEVFLGKGGHFPLWAGYTIGYLLVQKALRQTPLKNWDKIVRYLYKKETLNRFETIQGEKG